MNESTVDVPLPPIAILGLGSMGRSILSGLRGPGVRVDGEIRVTNRSVASAEEYTGVEGVISLATEINPEANREAVRGARVILLAVKPWQIVEVLTEVADVLDSNAVIVSVAAGVTTKTMEAAVPEGVAVLRAMPNTPSLIGRGVTGIARGLSASEEDLDQVRRVFETVGQVVSVPEDKIDALSAISGSGPAYVFLLIEEWTAAAERLGFSREEAEIMVRGTVSGAAELVMRTGEDPAELRRRVTSPNGTTEQAVTVLQAAQLGATLDEAMAAAVRRAGELAAE
ncbi:pyrroline-5-carboxylate reductase [Leucobacter sp. M11]|uniref:pyrroline-5-carboxylate reductase n=1 Tax=Leucobacter sp. M11 TaxID=2993565 RepID=UPI002D7E9E2F|nr:pyrroline-5-carboxylate reductase [Leucobacter sp. M11]MEB4614685.1 pyrroline-5-carboxylate reductase [Leucobacter sp. M11]